VPPGLLTDDVRGRGVLLVHGRRYGSQPQSRATHLGGLTGADLCGPHRGRRAVGHRRQSWSRCSCSAEVIGGSESVRRRPSASAICAPTACRARVGGCTSITLLGHSWNVRFAPSARPPGDPFQTFQQHGAPRFTCRLAIWRLSFPPTQGFRRQLAEALLIRPGKFAEMPESPSRAARRRWFGPLVAASSACRTRCSRSRARYAIGARPMTS